MQVRRHPVPQNIHLWSTADLASGLWFQSRDAKKQKHNKIRQAIDICVTLKWLVCLQWLVLCANLVWNEFLNKFENVTQELMLDKGALNVLKLIFTHISLVCCSWNNTSEGISPRPSDELCRWQLLTAVAAMFCYSFCLRVAAMWSCKCFYVILC